MPKELAQTGIKTVMEAASAAPPVVVFLPKSVVLHRTDQSDTTLWRKVRAGTFPAPVQISSGRVAWVEAEVLEWQRQRIADRDARKGQRTPAMREAAA
jgi:prophage regulatory protein